MDGYAAPLSYDLRDPLCIDGQRLRLVSGTNGAANATYKTERDTFVKVVIDEADQSGPTKLSVFRKDGLIERFGGSQAFIRGANRPDTTVAVSWLLAQTEDRYGNVIFYSYEKHGLGIYPSVISYTGSLTDSTLKANRSIRFLYETRPDVEFSASLGFQDLTERLTQIEVYGPSSSILDTWFQHPVRTYTLGYSNNSTTKRSLLTAISESDGNGNSLAPTNFDWEKAKTASQQLIPE
jgi:hypothetical protein